MEDNEIEAKGTVRRRKDFCYQGTQRFLARWFLPISGMLALLWFAVRVIPNPRRAAYPCQRAAAPLAAGFVAWLFNLVGSALLVRKARHLAEKSRWVLAGVCLVAGVGAILLVSGDRLGAAAGRGVFTPSDPPNTPFGIARGIFPGRVVWSWAPEATSWDGATGLWSEHIDQSVVDRMVSEVLTNLTGTGDDSLAWDQLFHHFNSTHGLGDVGYQPGEKIAVKVNLNLMVEAIGHETNPGNLVYSSPHVILAMLTQLVTHAGVPAADITVYDASRLIPNTIYDLCSGGVLTDVVFVDRPGGEGRIQAVHDPTVWIHHADPYVPPRWLPQSVTGAKYLINLGHLKAHNYAGVSLTTKNHFGSTWVESNSKFWPGEEIHHRINAYAWTEGPAWLDAPARPMGSYNPLVEIIGHQDLGEKTVLYLLDGLYVPAYQGGSMEEAELWVSEPFNQDWTSSLFASQDAVAIDSVGIDFLRSEPTQTYLADANNYSTVDDYLQEAALANDPPSGTFYDPEGDGSRLTSLGVHEHWNNAEEKLYSRNLGAGLGIELLALHVFRDGFESGDTEEWPSSTH